MMTSMNASVVIKTILSRKRFHITPNLYWRKHLRHEYPLLVIYNKTSRFPFFYLKKIKIFYIMKLKKTQKN